MRPDYCVKSISPEDKDRVDAMISVSESINRKNGRICLFIGETDGVLDQVEEGFGIPRIDDRGPAKYGSSSVVADMSSAKYPIIRLDLHSVTCTSRYSFDSSLLKSVKNAIIDATHKYGNIWNGNYMTVRCLDMLLGIPRPYQGEEILGKLAELMYAYLSESDRNQIRRGPLLLIEGYDSVLDTLDNGKDAEYCMKAIGRLINSACSEQSPVSSIVLTGNNNLCLEGEV